MFLNNLILRLKLTKAEFEIFKNLTSCDFDEIRDGLYKFDSLKTYNLVPYLDFIEINLPQIKNDPRTFGVKWRAEIYFKKYKHFAKGGKCNCIFFEKYGHYFSPESKIEHQNLEKIGIGEQDFTNQIDEIIYKCKNCQSIWAVNINYGYHFPVAEWRKI